MAQPWENDPIVQPGSGGGLQAVPLPEKPPNAVDLERLDIARRADARAQQAHDAKMAQQTQAADPADAVSKLTKVIDQIDYLYGDSSDNAGWGETGWLGSQLRDTGGTAAYDLGRQVQTVEANAAFDALQRMREASPTGGALGQVTERELDLLKASVSAIDPNQSQEEFLRSLGVAKGVYLDMLRRLDPAAADAIEQRGNPVIGPGGVITYSDEQRELLGVPAVNPDAPPPAGGSGGGGGGAPPQAGGPGLGGQLADATQSTIAGMAQGAAGVYDLPMQAATGIQRGVNYGVGEGIGALLHALGLQGAADWWRQGAASVDADLAARKSVADLIEEASPTPEGMEAGRFVSQLVGGAAVPIGPKAAPRSRAPAAPAANPNEVIEAGKQAGVRVMTSDVRPPRTFIGKTARATGERIPIAGTGGPRAAQQNERIEAVREMAREYGADAASNYLDQVSDDLAATRGARIQALTNQKKAVIEGIGGQVPVNRAIDTINREVADLQRVGAPEFLPIIQRLQGWRQSLQGKTLADLEQMRKVLGSAFDDPNLAAIRDRGQQAVNAIYAPLREDMGTFIARNGTPEQYRNWAKANDELAQMAGDLDDAVFRNVLKTGETTPENVARLLFSKKPSEVRRLVGNLSPEGRAKAQAAVIARAVDKAGGMDNISPDRFANEIGRLGESIGVVFEGADLARIRGLERLLQATKQAGAAGAAPLTGVQNTPVIGGIAAGSAFGWGSIPFLASAGLLARAYESAPVRNLLAGLGMSKPGSENERRLLERILKVATSQAEIRGPSANDVLAASPSRVAASEREND